MNTEINVFLQAQQFGQNATQQILEKKIGFEISFSNPTERSRRILTLDELLSLKEKIDVTLEEYNRVVKSLS